MTLKKQANPKKKGALPEGQTSQGFPIVGIGASAGGLAAFEAFFSAMPADTDSGMAFILVQHLAPDHKSLLSELIQRYTRMQVIEVEDGMKVEPNHAYIIPPNRDMAFLNGALQLLEPAAPRGQRLPIDFFFRSLAADQHERAIGIILSGTGSDGALGVRSIKAEGGMVMSQNPESTEYDGMPRSAIATGLVDYVLPPAEMPAQLSAFVAHAFGNLSRLPTPTAAPSEDALKKLFVLLRAHTGHDFSLYKPTTITRRVARRMAVNQIDDLNEYVRYLQHTPAELDLVFNDLLIGVTSFFRDKDAFAVLEAKVIPSLFEGKTPDAPIRVWTAGCSTGEEAYSIAILLQERMEALKQHFNLQVFATDIDKKSVEQARAGLYSDSIIADVTPERLSRFFVQDLDGNYRVHKRIRDILVFSEQDLIKDPPFSKLDLISCRNLMIYMGAELQKKIIPLFHYALKPHGMLFLGTSETIGEYLDLFSTVDRQAKLYQRKDGSLGSDRTLLLKYMPPWVESTTVAKPAGRSTADKKISLRELTEQGILKHCASTGALVNERGDFLYLHGHAGRYLEPTPGEQGLNNILKMAREGLKRDLTIALHKAVTQKKTIVHNGLQVKTNGDFSSVDITIHPIAVAPESAEGSNFFLVILEDTPLSTQPGHSEPFAGAPNDQARLENLAQIEELKRELRAKEEYLQSANEELETSNEELKSSNEEMQSVNEELQSTNEELETSKEELQSVNEELSTVNIELQTKLSDLALVNNDMNNLLAGTGVGTIFVDHQLRIRRFTPAVTQVINLIQSDVGRPVAHIASNLTGYDSLVEDLQVVLDSLAPREVEVRTKAGEWFLLRIRPYRTLENVIEGGVISFFDITEMKQIESALRETEAKCRVLFETMPQGVVFLNQEGQIINANSAAERILGLSLDQMKQRAPFSPLG
ncbi:MAG TPA: chemotaxis protein CheB, partial [Negativicutes bacterium]|nr:chemotaxis protein CheB [Negativicutes bacterium]